MKVKVAQLCPTLCFPMVYTVHGILQARILEWVAFAFSRGSSQPWIEPRSPTLQVDSSPAEPQGKPKNTGVHSLSLLQGIFLTQESNQGLLYCRWILYQLSYQGRRPWKSAENFAFLVPLQVSSESPLSPTFFLLAKRPKGESRMGRTISAFEFLKVSSLSRHCKLPLKAWLLFL